MDRYSIVFYNDSYYRLIYEKNVSTTGNRSAFDFSSLVDNRKVDKDEVERISLSRTKRNIKEIALCNSFEYFATLTINSDFCNRYSLSDCQLKLKTILKKIKRKHKNFAYIFITEKHKDHAFHFHGLIKGLEDDFYINNNLYLSNEDFDTLGFNSFSLIEDYNKCCNYILKYITKECIKNEHNQIYISSRGLRKADRLEVSPFPIDKFPCFENDFVKYYDFDFSSLPDDLKKIITFDILPRNKHLTLINFNDILKVLTDKGLELPFFSKQHCTKL